MEPPPSVTAPTAVAAPSRAISTPGLVRHTSVARATKHFTRRPPAKSGAGSSSTSTYLAPQTEAPGASYAPTGFPARGFFPASRNPTVGARGRLVGGDALGTTSQQRRDTRSVGDGPILAESEGCESDSGAAEPGLASRASPAPSESSEGSAPTGAAALLPGAAAASPAAQGEDADDVQVRRHEVPGMAPAKPIGGYISGAGGKSVESHVAKRAARALRLRARSSNGGACGVALSAWANAHALLLWIGLASLLVVLAGLALQYGAPGASFGSNLAYKWMYLLGGTGLSYVPLVGLESALFAVVEAAVAATSMRWATEALDFATAARGRLAPIAVVVLALPLKDAAFDLALPPKGEFYFSAACAALLVGLCGSVGRAVALKVALRHIFELKHAVAVRDVIFYEETCRNLTAPLPDLLVPSPADAETVTEPIVQPVAHGPRPSSAPALLPEDGAAAPMSVTPPTPPLPSEAPFVAVNVAAAPVCPPMQSADGVASQRRRLAAQRTLAVALRRAMTPTRALESDSFWTQAAYVRNSPSTAHDAEGRVCLVDSDECADVLSGEAFDRLVEAKAQRLRREAQAQRRARWRRQDAVEAADTRAERRRQDEALAAAATANGAAPPPVAGGIAGTARRTLQVALHAAMMVGAAGTAAVSGLAAVGRNQILGHPLLSGDIPATPPLLHMPRGRSAYLGASPTVSVPNVSKGAGRAVVRSVGAAAATSPAELRTIVGNEDAAADVRLSAALASLSPPSAALLSRDDLACCFFRRSDLDAAFRLLDLEGSSVVGRAAFVTTVRLMNDARRATQVALSSYGGITDAISMLASTIFWIIYVIVVLVIFQVDFNAVFVPLSTLVLGFGFALGPAIQRVIDSLAFVLVVAPFDVGDRVQISGVSNNAQLVVLQINILTSWFMDVDKRLVVRNSDIYGMTITNRRYSSNASLSVNVAVDQGATAAQLRALHEAVKAHVQALPLEWRPGVSMVVGATDAAGQPPNRVTVSFWLTHHASWQEPGKISLAQTELTIAVLELAASVGLRYAAPPAPLEVSGPRIQLWGSQQLDHSETSSARRKATAKDGNLDPSAPGSATGTVRADGAARSGGSEPPIAPLGAQDPESNVLKRPGVHRAGRERHAENSDDSLCDVGRAFDEPERLRQPDHRSCGFAPVSLSLQRTSPAGGEPRSYAAATAEHVSHHWQRRFRWSSGIRQRKSLPVPLLPASVRRATDITPVPTDNLNL